MEITYKLEKEEVAPIFVFSRYVGRLPDSTLFSRTHPKKGTTFLYSDDRKVIAIFKVKKWKNDR